MHPAIPFAVTYGPDLAAWLLAHASELGDAFARLTRPVMAAITDPTASLDRIGSALVAQQNGQAEVLGLLHQHTAKLDGIAAAVDGIGTGQQAVAHSLSLLTSLSIVGLGVAALSQVHLAFQFAALTRRLDRLAAEVRQVKALIQAEYRAELQAGLAKLEKGLHVADVDPDQAATLFGAAANTLTDSSANYAEQLRTQLGAADSAYLWLLARHLTVSALGEAAAHLRLGQKSLAVRSLETALIPLRDHARAVFARTVVADPARFLIPAMAAHGVTLEAVAELYRQAGHAGAVESDERLSAADRFEALRGRLSGLRDPRFRVEAVVRRLTAAWSEASAAVEELNRFQGLAYAIDAYHSPTRTYDDLTAEILREVDVRRPPDRTCLAFFPAPA